MRRAASYTLWWAALFCLYLFFQGDLARVDVVAAACAATLGAGVAEIARTVSPSRFRIEPRRVLPALKVPWQVVSEFGLIAWALVARRGVEGRFRTVPFPAPGDGPAGRGLRAFVSLATTYSPNSYVVDVDEREGVALIHELVPRRRKELL